MSRLIWTHQDITSEVRELIRDMATLHAEIRRDQPPEIRPQLRELGRFVADANLQFRRIAGDVEREVRRPMAGHAVGWEEGGGEEWYVSAGWNYGNITKTANPGAAQLWTSPAAVKAWLDELRWSRGESPRTGKPWPPPLIGLSGRQLKLLEVRSEIIETGMGYKIPDISMDNAA